MDESGQSLGQKIIRAGCAMGLSTLIYNAPVTPVENVEDLMEKSELEATAASRTKDSNGVLPIIIVHSTCRFLR
ncbi:hypothetical protein BDR07DRAFT_1390780 [Suillus spraguei]|nr:hypothetical protein BDR07DRAFT_1390780 [Suillus spraguei]